MKKQDKLFEKLMRKLATNSEKDIKGIESYVEKERIITVRYENGNVITYWK